MGERQLRLLLLEKKKIARKTTTHVTRKVKRGDEEMAGGGQSWMKTAKVQSIWEKAEESGFWPEARRKNADRFLCFALLPISPNSSQGVEMVCVS